MRKLQIEDAEIMRIAIQQEIGRSEESRYDHRLHGLLLVTAGQSCREVADLFGETGPRYSAGCAASRRAAWTRCAKASGRDDPARSMRSNGVRCRAIYVKPHATSGCRPLCGTVRSCRNICAGATRWTWGCASVSDYFVRWSFGYASRAPKSLNRIR